LTPFFGPLFARNLSAVPHTKRDCQTSGVVTLEDAIETLPGREIVDESDVVEDMQELAKVKYRERLRQNRQKQGIDNKD
jgi:hypothetical protein